MRYIEVDFDYAVTPTLASLLQGISMMLWGLATLEYTPKQALLDKSTVQIKRRIEEFSERPQVRPTASCEGR